MKIFSLLLNPALGASFVYGAYQTWIVIKNSVETSDNRGNMRTIKHQQRILKFWVVMICMLTVTPLLDLIFGFIFGPLWSIFRMLIFWQVAYSKTLGSGWLFEQYELGAPYIEEYILKLIIVFREGRTLVLDHVYSGVLQGVHMIIKVFLSYASRPVLRAVRDRIKEVHWVIQTELKKPIRPGHRRETPKERGSESSSVQMINLRKSSTNAGKEKHYTK